MRSRTSIRLLLCGGVALAALGASAEARAQDAPPAPTTTAPAKPAAPPVDDKQLAEARRQFDAGVALLEDPDGAKYEDAYRAFKKAYELSQSSKVLGNIAFCALHLERDGEAIDSYTTYLREVPDISERERTQIQRDLQTMMATMARIHVVSKSPMKGATIIDRRIQTRGQAVENVYEFDGMDIVLRLRPGRHTLIVRNGTTESAPFETTIEPGNEITFTPQEQVERRDIGGAAPSAPGSRSVAGPIIVGSLGIVAIGVGVATGIVAKNKTNDVEKSCTLPGDFCPTTYNLADAKSSAKTFATIADVGFISGGVLIAGAAVWYLLTPKEGRAAPAPPPAGTGTVLKSVKPTAMCLSTGCAFNVVGDF